MQRSQRCSYVIPSRHEIVGLSLLPHRQHFSFHSNNKEVLADVNVEENCSHHLCEKDVHNFRLQVERIAFVKMSRNEPLSESEKLALAAAKQRDRRIKSLHVDNHTGTDHEN
ncbi:hypothetical protein Tcan_08805 [Toxocara canis]|uniref:Uncharacterized protein n=1 Tax=Toxocara canis TaxID=6265 RepID=A0A0B2USS5_TOXCA|nr:hypothetical protein Tcan_08805 [Toxocara canis]